MAFKRIADYSPADLDVGVNEAIVECRKANLDFYKILKGVDCYFERRKRKLEAEEVANRLKLGTVKITGAKA